MAKKKILIVEDDGEQRMGLSIRLQANNYDPFLLLTPTPLYQ